MKKIYETPEMEVFSFETTDEVMDSGCTAYTGAVCPADGCTCFALDINISSVGAIWDEKNAKG